MTTTCIFQVQNGVLDIPHPRCWYSHALEHVYHSQVGESGDIVVSVVHMVVLDSLIHLAVATRTVLTAPNFFFSTHTVNWVFITRALILILFNIICKRKN